jgi:hypothetical protein
VRWEKDGKFIEVCSGLEYTAAHNAAVSWVESNAFDGRLPLEWRGRVPHSDTEPARLIARIKKYAEENGFKIAKPTC